MIMPKIMPEDSRTRKHLAAPHNVVYWGLDTCLNNAVWGPQLFFRLVSGLFFFKQVSETYSWLKMIVTGHTMTKPDFSSVFEMLSPVCVSLCMRPESCSADVCPICCLHLFLDTTFQDTVPYSDFFYQMFDLVFVNSLDLLAKLVCFYGYPTPLNI